jgi:DNA repair exonuclease SbcCD ATPase subunit
MSNYDDDDDFDDYGGGPSVVAMVLPFATAIAALALGAVLGTAIGWVIKPAEKVEVKVPRDLTAAELAAACAPQVNETVNELEKAQSKVAQLEDEVQSRQSRVEELEAQLTVKKSSSGGSNLARELAQAKADLAEAREQLSIAEAEKERLVVELTQTKQKLAETEEDLEEQIEKTELAKEDALTNKWYRFLNDAQLEICEKGNRKKLGKCRETVEGNLMSEERRNKFAHCVRSGQAVPTVYELDKKATLPDFSEMINEEAKQTKGWYVMFCDPTLPERDDGFLNEEHLPG